VENILDIFEVLDPNSKICSVMQ